MALSIVSADGAAAQGGGRGGRDDGAAARTDAILATPNRVTPVPPANLFSTSPGVTQQAPVSPSPEKPGSEKPATGGSDVGKPAR